MSQKSLAQWLGNLLSATALALPYVASHETLRNFADNFPIGGLEVCKCKQFSIEKGSQASRLVEGHVPLRWHCHPSRSRSRANWRIASFFTMTIVEKRNHTSKPSTTLWCASGGQFGKLFQVSSGWTVHSARRHRLPPLLLLLLSTV